MRKSKTITIKVRGIDLDWMERAMEKDDMDEEELFSCLIRMSMPIYCENPDDLTDQELGQTVRKARDIFLSSRELTV